MNEEGDLRTLKIGSSVVFFTFCSFSSSLPPHSFSSLSPFLIGYIFSFPFSSSSLFSILSAKFSSSYPFLFFFLFLSSSYSSLSFSISPLSIPHFHLPLRSHPLFFSIISFLSSSPSHFSPSHSSFSSFSSVTVSSFFFIFHLSSSSFSIVSSSVSSTYSFSPPSTAPSLYSLSHSLIFSSFSSVSSSASKSIFRSRFHHPLLSSPLFFISIFSSISPPPHLSLFFSYSFSSSSYFSIFSSLSHLQHHLCP
jgi:hypothetical protein